MQFKGLVLSLSLCLSGSAAFVASRRAFLGGAAAAATATGGGVFGGRAAVSATSRMGTVRHMSQSPQDLVAAEIAAHRVVVFSKTYCPYCSSTKALLDDLKVDYTAIELDTRDDGPAIQQALLDRTGQRTVPNTFIGGKHLGGNDKLQAAHRAGELQKLLAQ